MECSNRCELLVISYPPAHSLTNARYMAREEMKEITVDKWDEEVWGAAESTAGVPRPKLFFLFGEKDHWVADKTRNELIRLRGRKNSDDDWKPFMEIDKGGVPHGFTLCRFATEL